MKDPVELGLPSTKGFSLGDDDAPRAHRNLETFMINTAGEGAVLLAQSGWGPGMPLSTPQCTGHPHTTENEEPQVSIVGNLGLEPTKSLQP